MNINFDPSDYRLFKSQGVRPVRVGGFIVIALPNYDPKSGKRLADTIVNFQDSDVDGLIVHIQDQLSNVLELKHDIEET